jgi:hypothetical protein
LVGNFKLKGTFARPRCRRADAIKICLKVIGKEFVGLLSPFAVSGYSTVCNSEEGCQASSDHTKN